MHKLSVVTVLFITAVLSACQPARGPQHAPEAYQVLAPKDPNNALVYIYRKEQDWAAKSGSWPAVFLNQQLVGSLKYKGYLMAEVPAGEYVLSATGLSKSSRRWDFADKEAKFTLQPGHVRFFQLTAKYDQSSNTMLGGRMKFLVYLTAMEHEDAKYDMYGLRLSE